MDKNELRYLVGILNKRGILGPDIVEVIRRYHPRFDKTTLSKCVHGSVYGVKIRPAALDALYREFAPEHLPQAKHKRNGCHRLRRSVSCRLDDKDYAAVQRCIADDGFETIQDWLAHLIKQRLAQNPEKEAPNVKTNCRRQVRE